METKAAQRKWLLPAVCAACAVCLVVAAVLAVFALKKPGDSLELDDNATMGILPGVDVAQRQQELQQQLDETMIAFSINASPVFASGSAEGNLMLENPANNAKLLGVERSVDGTGGAGVPVQGHPGGLLYRKRQAGQGPGAWNIPRNRLL